MTGFTNEEEKEMELTDVVPFLVEDELKRLGAKFEKVPNWRPFSIVDGRLITGRIPIVDIGRPGADEVAPPKPFTEYTRANS